MFDLFGLFGLCESPKNSIVWHALTELIVYYMLPEDGIPPFEVKQKLLHIFVSQDKTLASVSDTQDVLGSTPCIS